jgi:catechol-2,3-dioxygenase
VSSAIDGFAELTLEAVDLDALRNARLGLWCPGKKEHGDEGGRHVHFAFAAATGALPGVAGRLRSLGHEVEVTEHEGGDCSLYIEDPEGNVVELWDYYDPR